MPTAAAAAGAQASAPPGDTMQAPLAGLAYAPGSLQPPDPGAHVRSHPKRSTPPPTSVTQQERLHAAAQCTAPNSSAIPTACNQTANSLVAEWLTPPHDAQPLSALDSHKRSSSHHGNHGPCNREAIPVPAVACSAGGSATTAVGLLPQLQQFSPPTHIQYNGATGSTTGHAATGKLELRQTECMGSMDQHLIMFA
jgi:hypothetical protein